MIVTKKYSGVCGDPVFPMMTATVTWRTARSVVVRLNLVSPVARQSTTALSPTLLLPAAIAAGCNQ